MGDYPLSHKIISCNDFPHCTLYFPALMDCFGKLLVGKYDDKLRSFCKQCCCRGRFVKTNISFEEKKCNMFVRTIVLSSGNKT